MKNKIFSILLIVLGILSTIPEGDGTALLFFLIIAIPLFFAKNNYITW